MPRRLYIPDRIAMNSYACGQAMYLSMIAFTRINPTLTLS